MSVRPTAWELGSQPLPQDSDWLLPFLPALRVSGPRLLEAGCGPGLDAATLTAAGFAVVGFDRAQLRRARTWAPAAQFLRADLAWRLPFRDGAFDSAISSLALHYLPWNETVAAFREIRRVLRQDAPFLFRVNASDDTKHGAGQGVELEPNFYRVPMPGHSDTKRFFDEAMVRAAVAGSFAVTALEHRTIHRYEQPKQVWECLATAVG